MISADEISDSLSGRVYAEEEHPGKAKRIPITINEINTFRILLVITIFTSLL